MTVYESTIRIHAEHDLTDDQQRAWGDAMADAAKLVGDALWDVDAPEFKVETHGPAALVA